MSQVYETPAILLRQIDLPDEDRLGVFFTREYGKRTLLLKGIKKAQAKLQYRLREGEVREIEFIRGKSIDRLTAIHQDTVGQESSSSDERHRWALVTWMCRVVDSLVEEDGEDGELFGWCLQAEDLIRRIPSGEIQAVFGWMVVRVLFVLGYGLDVSQCVVTGEKRSNRFFISVEAGGLLVESVIRDYPHSLMLSREDILTFRKYQQGLYTGQILPPKLLEQYIQWYSLPDYPDFFKPDNVL